MDFNSLVRGALPTFAVNMTGNAKNGTKGGLDDSIIENLMPLLGGRINPLMHAFMLLYNMVGSRVGVDPTVILTAMGFFWATNKLWAHLYTAVYGFIQEYLTTSVHINGGDEIYLHLMKWLASQPYLSSSRSLMAESTSRSAWDEEENADVATAPISADGSGIYLNFSRQEAKSVSLLDELPIPWLLFWLLFWLHSHVKVTIILFLLACTSIYPPKLCVQIRIYSLY